jgi:hypothetical protein
LNNHQIPISKITALTDRARDLVVDDHMAIAPAAKKAFKEFKDAGHIVATTPSPARTPAPESTELGEQDPAFASGEEDLAGMVADQAAGKNPYLKKAQAIYNKIKGDLKPERAEKTKHALAALTSVESGDESALIAKYKELSGSTRVRTFPWDDVEKATFHTKEELKDNIPVDVPLERMKRGYAAKQFARSTPYLKDSWKSANTGAPPPMPTFGDFKSWTDHGSRPSWAGTRSRIAVPKEIFDAAVKVGGKPQYPPSWMPIHLMPVWNYVAKKSDAPYATRAPGAQQISPAGKVDVGSQAVHQEGMVISSLRKYVQMRGGAKSLVDIPALKLQEAGLTHADIFKADKELSDAQLKKLVTTKVIDHVELLKIIKKDMPKPKKEAKKSFFVEKSIQPEEFVIDICKGKKEGFYVDARKI